jgi:thiamine biosynthesis lipoprotein
VTTVPFVETLPVGADTRQWSLWSTTARVVVTDPRAADEAARIVEHLADDVERACSRFRPDSELSQLAGHRGLPATVSPLLAELIRTALDAARATEGAVTPTIGSAVSELGYDRDWSRMSPPRPGTPIVVRAAPRWQDVIVDGTTLTVPPGVHLDLGATAKAWTADRAAALVAADLDVGVLVGLGGDLATAGPAPSGGWRVLVRDQQGDPSVVVTVPAGAAVATSSTRSRRWRSAGRELHHVVDPATCQPAPAVWRSITVAASSCVVANTISTGALVRAGDAVDWLRRRGLPARLVTAAGDVVTVNGWPSEESS